MLYHRYWTLINISEYRGGSRGVVANVPDYGIVVSEFELQSRYLNNFLILQV